MQNIIYAMLENYFLKFWRVLGKSFRFDDTIYPIYRIHPIL